MRYFKDTTGQVHGYDETIAAFEPYIEKAIENNWKEVTGSYPLAETKEQAQNRLSPSITSAINDEAHQWGYDILVNRTAWSRQDNIG